MQNRRVMLIVALLMIIFGVVILANAASAASDVTVYVEDANGNRISQASVDIDRIDEVESLTVWTDENGMVTVNLEEGTYRFIASYAGSVSFSVTREITDPGPHEVNLVIYQSIFDFFGTIGLLGFFIIIILFIFYIWILYMVYKDAEARGQNGVLWLLIVFFTGLIGLIIWLLVRGGLKKSKK